MLLVAPSPSASACSYNFNLNILSPISHPLNTFASSEIYGFGKSTDGTHGRLGCKLKSLSQGNIITPRSISSSLTSIIKLSTFSSHTLGLTSYGDVYSWGQGKNCQLGHENKNNQLLPKLINYINTNNIIKYYN